MVVYGYHLVVFLRKAAHFVEIDLSALRVKVYAKAYHTVFVKVFVGVGVAFTVKGIYRFGPPVQYGYGCVLCQRVKRYAVA